MIKNQFVLKQILNYRILFAYFMLFTYLFTHYFVTFTDFERENNFKTNLNLNLNEIKNRETFTIGNFNSKKLLNYINTNKLLLIKNKRSILLDKLIRKSKKIIQSNLNLNLKFDLPSNKNKLDNLNNLNKLFSSQIYQDQILVHLLNSSKLNESLLFNGLFLEAGAYDGQTHSNTFYLEKYLNWTGLLIEPSLNNYKKLLKLKRNSYSINSCLSSGQESVKTNFIDAGPFGITTNLTNLNENNILTCYSLDKILDEFFNQFDEINNKKSNFLNYYFKNSDIRVIDYFSLDIEGNEKLVLESFPMNKYRFNLINIEYNQNKEFYKWLIDYMKMFGYKETLVDDVWYQDVYLAHESIYSSLNLNILKVSDFLNYYIKN